MAALGVDIRLLGPLEMFASAPVALGGPRQRTLLGLLALRAPHVVGVPSLIDGIWGEDPPPSATKTLHAHMAYLRRALGRAGLTGLIVTRPPGYALAAGADTVDAHRFRELVRRARSTLADGTAEETALGLRAALALWRGEVLADCPIGEWARAEAAALSEDRRYAIEDLYAAELALGRHERVAADLEALVMREPLRERLWELLMIALYRAGRQGDALAAYQRARSTLIDELGIEPGPALRNREAEILAGSAPVLPGERTPAAAVGPAATVGPVGPVGLPAPLTSLIGRERETDEVRDLLTNRRLVTLTGPGGCGKTRVAIAVATRVVDRFSAGVHFVDLTSLADPAQVAATVAHALDVPERPDLDPLESLGRELGPARRLLVLDNCEHVLDGCAELVGTLLTRCPELYVLATSRQPLGIPGEAAWPVPALAVPTTAVAGLADACGYAAVRLLVDRADVSAVRELTDDDAAALVAICAGVDGLPLAIELAAARTTVLTVQEIADRIHDPGLLRTVGGGRREHHDALDATIAWSYRLLDPAQRSRFRRLAVFRGGCTRPAVRAVLAPRAERGQSDVVDLLAELVGRSLVVVDRRRSRSRYRLLETIRQYAQQRLAESEEELADASRRHAAHYLGLAEDIDKNLQGPELENLLERMAVEHDNLVAALAWLAGHGPPADELRLAAALARYWHLRGRYHEGRRWLEDALSRADGLPATPELARARLNAAYLAFFECDYAGAAAQGERALANHRELARADDREGARADHRGAIARALSLLASVDREGGRYRQSLERYAEAAAIYRDAGDEAGLADTQLMAGFAGWLAGDLRRAEEHVDDALERFQRIGDPEGVASARTHRAAVAFYQGQFARARWLAEDALVRFRQLDFKEGIAWALNICGLVERHDGNAGRAADLLRGSLEIHCAVGDRWRAASVLDALGAVFADDGAVQFAAEMLGASSAIRAAIGAPVPRQERASHDAALAVVRGRLDEARFYAAHGRGEARGFSDLASWLAELDLPAGATSAQPERNRLAVLR